LEPEAQRLNGASCGVYIISFAAENLSHDGEALLARE
jgi:hypothetical protein